MKIDIEKIQRYLLEIKARHTQQGNRGMEIEDPKLRQRIETTVRQLLEAQA